MDLFQKIRQYAQSDKIAIEYGEDIVSYKLLYKNIVSWSNYIRSKYEDNDIPVIIYGHKENGILPCMLGCILSGRAYVPIDITFPKNRFETIVSLVKPKLIVNFSEENIDEYVDKCTEVLNLNQIDGVLLKNADLDFNELPFIKDEQLCYIIFTSGSTGNPKGVEISWLNLKHYMDNFTHLYFKENVNEKFLNSIPYSFDLSVGYIYVALYYGNTLYTVDKKTSDNLKVLFENLSKSSVSVIVSTPSLVEMFFSSTKFNKELMPNLSKFIFCGEILPNKLAKMILEHFPHCLLVNTFGPTEATVLITSEVITMDMAESDTSLTIGKPFDGITLCIVDEKGVEVQEGEKGELQIIGNSVSRGYFNQKELTDKVFFKDSITGKQGYNTGDICYKENELYYFCSRNDFQIKLNGNRIEIGDIENNLTKIKYVKNAVVFPVSTGDKIDYLLAFVTLSEMFESSSFKIQSALKKELGKLVSAYMVPKKIIVIDNIPLNANGKIDRKLLEVEVKRWSI